MINQGRYLLIKITDSYGKLYKQIEEQSPQGLSPRESVPTLTSYFCFQPTLGFRVTKERLVPENLDLLLIWRIQVLEAVKQVRRDSGLSSITSDLFFFYSSPILLSSLA